MSDSALPKAGFEIPRRRAGAGLLLAVLLTFSLAVLSLCVGRYTLHPMELFRVLLSRIFPIERTWPKMSENVVFRVRLPRVCAALLIGGGLSLSGASYQGIFRNPLVSPDLLGISAGACVGAAVAILLGRGSGGIQLLALIGGLGAVASSMLIPRILKNGSALMLVLSGVIVHGFMNAVIGILKYIADTETQLPAITYWQMGSLADSNPEKVLSVAPAMLLSAAAIIVLSWQVNLLSLGEAEASTLGVNIKAMRGVLILFSTLLTGCSVCIAGIVGWVGLIVPHLTRLLIGPDNTRLMPLSFFVGAGFLLLIDTLARTLSASEIPLSILTGAIGAPLFIWLLAKTRTRL